MLETIANPAGGNPMPTFLATPRSMMPGSWVCESPKASAASTKVDRNNLSIEIPKLVDNDQHQQQRTTREAKPEQRDAAEHTESCCVSHAPQAAAAADKAQQQQRQQNNNNNNELLSPITSEPSKFECDYDLNPTDIFLSLQKKEWDNAAKKALESPVEAHTWVSRKEKHGKLRWRLLPIHAAIIFKAPENVVETLLAAYPKGAQCKDDQGMLPLHLAFRHGSTEGTVNLLLVAFPQSVEVKDRKGRIPLVLAQASASPNRDAFVRALERGPTYYASAAAATERAAVTAEQRAIFDSKLIEVEKKHQQDVNILKEERKGLMETVELLQKEMAKQKGATQVLVDHVNSLEAQLKTKTETERFLAVKAATLDSNWRELCDVKEQGEEALMKEIAELKLAHQETIAELKKAHRLEMAEIKKENKNLEQQVQNALNIHHGEITAEELKHIKDKAARHERELKSLKMDWASAQARAAVLEAQLKSKIENEHELASQVSHLAAKLAESAADSGNAASHYSKRLQVLEEEREKLRATVNDLGKKLLKVSHFMNKMTQKTQETTKKCSEEAKLKRAKLLADAVNHEQLVRTALAERNHMSELMKKQEEEMKRSAQQHEEILAKLAQMRTNAPIQVEEPEEAEVIPFSHSLTEEMHQMMSNVLTGIPQEVSSDDSDLVEAVMKNVEVYHSPPKSKRSHEEEEEAKKSMQSFLERALRASSSSSEDDPQKCMEEALRALELSRNHSIGDNLSHQHDLKKAMSSDSDETSLSCNPSDEEKVAESGR